MTQTMKAIPKGQFILAAITLLLSGTSIYAHHGRDFLLVQSAHIPEQGSLYGISTQDYIQEDKDEYEFEPALIYGALDWLALEVHGHIEKENGESFNYESTAPAAHLRFTPRSCPLGLGLSAEYEFARHEDEADVVELSGKTSFEHQKWTIAFNLNYEKAEEEDEEWGYATGVRRFITDNTAIGIEIDGTFEEEESGEVLCAIYSDINERFTINAGIGAGFNSDVDLTVRTALIWRFN